MKRIRTLALVATMAMEVGGATRTLAADEGRSAAGPQDANPPPIDGDPVALSNKLFNEAKAYLASGDVVSACVAFARSNALVPRVGTMLNLGLCREREGRLLSAREALQTALALLTKEGGRHDRVEIAVEHLRSVEAALSWLSFDLREVPSEASVEVRMDGALVDVSSGPIPVEGGVHRITATAAACVPWDTEISLSRAAEKRTIRIGPLVPLVPAAGRAPTSAPTPAALTGLSTAVGSTVTAGLEAAPVPRGELSSPPPSPADGSERPPRARKWLWVGGGITVVAAAVVTVLLVASLRSPYPSSTVTETYP